MSVTRLLAIGDIHQRHADPRNPQRLRALDQAIEHGLSLAHLGLWILLGDLFDATTTPEDRNAMYARALRMGAVAPVAIVGGNHDPEGELAVFGCLHTNYPIIVRDRADVVTLTLATEIEATMFLLPWPSAAGLIAQRVAPGDIQAVAREQLDALFIDAAAKLETARERGHVTLFAGHATAVGAIASTGQPQGAQGVAIDAAMLARLGPCPKLLGHIHAPQEIAGAIYAGSVSRGDFGEVEDKRVLALAFESDWPESAQPWVYAVESVPLSVPRMWHLEGDYHDQQLTWRVTKGPAGEPLEAPASFDGDELRLRVRVRESEWVTYQAAVKDGLYANWERSCLRFLADPVCVPDRAARAPEVAAAKTLREKVLAWATVTRTVVAEDVLDALDQLERMEPERLLALVQADVDELAAPGATVDERAVAVA
jgi:DNA repair exonuclease SbcCD nuclease subunit